jgi:prolyl-tRNA editing enzyme YbaK/EbsC (Cys-tRNA(Pro) deacylase)
MSELPPSARKVQDAASALGLDVTVREMTEPTRTAQEAASACGVTAGQIVKSLVFSGAASGKPYLLLVSGTNRVDEKGVATHLGEKLKRSDAEAVRALTGFAIGGIPPFGHATPLATYMDRDLLQ